MRICSINCLAAIGLVTAAYAAVGTAQMQMPKPPAEMADTAYFEGSWMCEGKTFETPMGPAMTMKSTADIRKDLNGHFQSGTIKGTSPNMPPFEGRFTVTYDPTAKQYIMMWVDNMGSWSQTTSSGWKGDIVVYEGESHMAGQTMKSRDTFTRSGPTSMKHTWEIEAGGKWMPAGEETCTKK